MSCPIYFIILFIYTGPSSMVGPTSPQVRGAGSTVWRLRSGRRRSHDTRRLAAAAGRRQGNVSLTGEKPRCTDSVAMASSTPTA